ncbi:hypothetical protein Krad_4620 (plasmid) [Kineococcus radiotolerans SRS30216 = ATCC BAA-149]|uniref:Uncharacterized protein n=1 Tax=Kineococcus radiotolerans (strain ATCC BAA-149 / DSM 14245 / SRS30216) TaxID=266940 RepID=A6WGZ0_KINRD|nr:hypothetical protein Krad_4620 [Kineococcus radiotolerans SRS30216 = ATCC BAA-149]
MLDGLLVGLEDGRSAASDEVLSADAGTWQSLAVLIRVRTPVGPTIITADRSDEPQSRRTW